MNSIAKKRISKGSGDSIFKYRYLIAFLEFWVLFEINVYRLTTSMSIVAMVNNTAISSHEIPNNSTISCSLKYSEEINNTLPEGILPAAISVLSANWFPKCERGFLNALILLGYSFGTLISGFSSGVMCSSSLFGGWPSVYYVYGMLGLVLCFCIYVFVFDSPMCHPRISDAELDFILKDQESDISRKRPPTPWKSILTSPQVYSMTYAMFGVYWVASQTFTIQPIFLETILHFSIEENGYFASFPFFFQVALTFTSSWISKWLNAHKYVGVDKVRKGSNLLFCLGYSLCMLGVFFAGCERTLSAVLSVGAMSFIGLSFSGSMITSFDMSPTFAGTLIGFSCTIGSLALFIFPVLVGILTDEQQTLEEWNKIFFISIGIIMSSGIIFCACGSAEIQPWNYPKNESLETIRQNENKFTRQVQKLEPASPVLDM